MSPPCQMPSEKRSTVVDHFFEGAHKCKLTIKVVNQFPSKFCVMNETQLRRKVYFVYVDIILYLFYHRCFSHYRSL